MGGNRATFKLDAAKRRAEWAEEKVKRLGDLVETFVQSDACVVRGKREADQSVSISVFQAIPIPSEINRLLSEFLFHARSSLEHLVASFALQNGFESLNDVGFPFADSAEKLRSGRPLRMVQGLSERARSFIYAQKPYLGGNDTLWAINRAHNLDKHRNLLAIAPDLQGILWTWKPGLDAKIFDKLKMMGPILLSLDVEIKLGTLPAGSDIPNEMKPAFEIIVSEVQTIEGDFVLNFVNKACYVVKEIVRLADERFFS